MCTLPAHKLGLQVVQTEWWVITGGASSGKSTLLRALGGEGFNVQEEKARALIEGARDSGVPLEDIFAEHQVRQDSIFAHDFVRHRSWDPAQLQFLDRGLPDAIGYMIENNLEGIDRCLEICDRIRYRGVLLLEPRPIERDGTRIEDEAYLHRVRENTRSLYERLGYTPIDVPCLDLSGEDVSNRVDFVLRQIGYRR